MHRTVPYESDESTGDVVALAPPPSRPSRRVAVWGGVAIALAGSIAILLLSMRRASADLRVLIDQAALGERLDPDLVAAVVHAESGGNARAASRAQAYGLMQLRVGTAIELAGREVTVEELFLPRFNLSLGCKYLRQLLDRYDGEVRFALMAYNAGPTRVARWRKLDPDPAAILNKHAFGETRVYVRRVLKRYRKLKNS